MPQSILLKITQSILKGRDTSLPNGVIFTGYLSSLLPLPGGSISLSNFGGSVFCNSWIFVELLLTFATANAFLRSSGISEPVILFGILESAFAVAPQEFLYAKLV